MQDINYVKSICYHWPVWNPRCNEFFGSLERFQDFGILGVETDEGVAASVVVREPDRVEEDAEPVQSGVLHD